MLRSNDLKLRQSPVSLFYLRERAASLYYRALEMCVASKSLFGYFIIPFQDLFLPIKMCIPYHSLALRVLDNFVPQTFLLVKPPFFAQRNPIFRTNNSEPSVFTALCTRKTGNNPLNNTGQYSGYILLHFCTPTGIQHRIPRPTVPSWCLYFHWNRSRALSRKNKVKFLKKGLTYLWLLLVSLVAIFCLFRICT